jgi:hypothetical protein
LHCWLQFARPKQFGPSAHQGHDAQSQTGELPRTNGVQAQIKVREVKASRDVADVFDLDDGEPIVRRDRRCLLDGRSVLVAVSLVPSLIACGTPIADRTRVPGGYARFAELGIAPDSEWPTGVRPW